MQRKFYQVHQIDYVVTSWFLLKNYTSEKWYLGEEWYLGIMSYVNYFVDNYDVFKKHNFDLSEVAFDKKYKNPEQYKEKSAFTQCVVFDKESYEKFIVELTEKVNERLRDELDKEIELEYE